MVDSLTLFSGKDIVIKTENAQDIVIKHPTIKDILDIGEENYRKYISVLTITKESRADELWFDQNIWYEDITSWDLVCQLRDAYIRSGEVTCINNKLHKNKKIMEAKVFVDAFKFFINIEVQAVIDKKENKMVFLGDNDILITDKTYEIIREIINKMNFVDEDYEFLKGGNKLTKEFLMKQTYRIKRRQRKGNVKVSYDLTSVLSSLMWKGNKGEEILTYPIWRIYEGFFRLLKINNYDLTMTAFYSGAIDTKKKLLDTEAMHWSRKL